MSILLRRGAGLLLNPYDKRGGTGMYGDGYAMDVPLDRDQAVMTAARYGSFTIGGVPNFQPRFDDATGTWFKEASTERCFKIKGSSTSIIFRLKVLSKMTWWGKGYLTPNIGDPGAGGGRYWGDGSPFSPTPPWAYGQGICTTKYSVLNLAYYIYDPTTHLPTFGIWDVNTKEMDPGSGEVTDSSSQETYPASVTTPPGSSAWYSGFYYRDEGEPITLDQLSVNESLSWDWSDVERCYLVARDKDDPENPAFSISTNPLTSFPFGEIPYADIYSSFYAYQSDEHGYSYGKVNRQLKIRVEAQLDAPPRDCCWVSGLKVKGSIKMKAWTLQTVLGSNNFNPTMIVPTPDADESLDFDESMGDWDGTPYYHGGAKAGEVMLVKEFEVSPDPGIAKAIEDFYIESVGY